MPPLARIEEIVRDCLATCSRAPHPKAPDAASNLRHHMQAIERDLYEVRDLLAALRRSTKTDKPGVRVAAGDDEMYEIGKRDGYEEAVQDIDLMTGGDGEYRVAVFLGGGVDEDRHCPDPAAMKARIADRFAALRRDEGKGVREAALEEAAKVADMFAADHAKSADQFGIDRNRELHNAAKGAAQGVAFAIRALSAPLAAEQPAADRDGSERYLDWNDPADAIAPLPRSTTGGAK